MKNIIFNNYIVLGRFARDASLSFETFQQHGGAGRGGELWGGLADSQDTVT